MKIFFDTSSLFKLYHEEEGTEELEKVFSQAKITEIFLSFWFLILLAFSALMANKSPVSKIGRAHV